MGSVFFKNTNFRKGVLLLRACTNQGGGGSKKEQFYANVMIEWLLSIFPIISKGDATAHCCTF